MAKGMLIPNDALLKAGLELMERNGKPLERRQSRGRAMLYSLRDGQTVRVRTCNDHILISVADSPVEDARLNIEGSDWILIVMPEIERTPGNIIAYLVPTGEAVAAVRRNYSAWIAGGANTKGTNTTWNIWFRPGASETASGFAEKWAKYRLSGTGRVDGFAPVEPKPAAQGGASETFQSTMSTGDKVRPLNIADAKKGLAAFYGVSLDAVEITIRG